MNHSASPFAKIRHELHQHPELSNQEQNTAQRIKQLFLEMEPDKVYENLGGSWFSLCFPG